MLNLSKLNENDLPRRVELLNNKDISSNLNVNENFTLEKTIKWFEKVKNDDSRYDCVFCQNDIIIGMGGLTHISDVDRNAELYMYIDPSFQGRGLGFFFLNLLCKYAFDKLDLNKIYLYTFTENAKANRLYEKAKFHLEGVLRKHTFKSSELKDRNIYGLLKEDFFENVR